MPLVTDSTQPALALGHAREHALGPGQLVGSDRLRVTAQLGDRGDDVEGRLPGREALGLEADDRLGAHGLLAPAREARLHDRLEIVDVVEVAVLELVDRRVEVARHGDVDQEQRQPLAPAARSLDLLPCEHEAGRAGGRDDDVRLGQHLRDLPELQPAGRELARQRGAALLAAVGHGDHVARRASPGCAR